MSEKKTALELVDGLMWGALEGSEEWVARKEVKSAIEREQANTIAITNELTQPTGDTTNILSNILRHWSKEKQRSLIRGMDESLIEMRPISELPDKVQGGCAVVQVNANGWVKVSSFPGGDLTVCAGATHFYILPLPKAERKLKPCPWCGGDVSVSLVFISAKKSLNGYAVTCDNDKCAARGPVRETKEQAEKARWWEDKGEL